MPGLSLGTPLAVYVIKKGRTVWSGTSSEVQSNLPTVQKYLAV
ncbi:hypothetical protein CDEF62S_01092 [Castellaniella defragrans]